MKITEISKPNVSSYSLSSKFKKINELLNKNNFFHESLGNINNIKNLQVLVISDPKTGSTTLAKCFQKCITDDYTLKNVIHMHTDQSCLFRLLPLLRQHEIGIKDLVDYRNEFNKEKLLIVTAYREPISKSISHFFEFKGKRINDRKVFLRTSPELLIDDFFKLQNTFLFNRHIHWQIREYFGIELLSRDFRKDIGVNYFEGDEYDLLKVRMDKIENVPAALVNNVYYNNLKIEKFNETSKSWYDNIYQSFNKNICFSRKILDTVFWVEQSYISHFLTDKEINELKEKWYSKSIESNNGSNSFFENFDYEKYLRANPELIKNGIVNDYEVRRHYVVHGSSSFNKVMKHSNVKNAKDVMLIDLDMAELVRAGKAECNICGSKEFGPMGNRPIAKCSQCGSLERTRVIKLFMDTLDMLKPGMKVLHLAPEVGLAKYIHSVVGNGYCSADLEIERYKKTVPNVRTIDLCQSLDNFEKGTFDLILHSHVLEHVPCNWTVSLKNLNDLLKSGGYHLCCIPIMKGRYEESLSPISKEEATRRFGQFNHVRRFGAIDLHLTLGMVVPLPKNYDLTKDYSEASLRKHNIPQRIWKGFTPDTVLVWKKEDFLL